MTLNKRKSRNRTLSPAPHVLTCAQCADNAYFVIAPELLGAGTPVCSIECTNAVLDGEIREAFARKQNAQINDVFSEAVQERLDALKPPTEETKYQCYECERYLGDLNFDVSTKERCPRNIFTGALQVICKECAEEEAE